MPDSLFIGQPSDGYPWSFAGYRMLTGHTACMAKLDDQQRTRLARPLAQFLACLHQFSAGQAFAWGASPDTLGRLDAKKRVRMAGSYLDRLHQLGLIAEVRPLTAVVEAFEALSRAQQPTDAFGDLQDIDFAHATNGWIVGQGGLILHTTDRGETWIRYPSGTTNALLGIDFIDAETGWISGEGGTILRFTGEDTGIAIEDEPGEVPASFALASNYPNPFNPQTTISFVVPEAGPVQLEVVDVWGRLIETLVDGGRQAGTHTVVWQATSRPSGVYFYRLQAGHHTETRKMILLR